MVGISMRELDALAGLQAGHTRVIQAGEAGRVAASTLEKIAGVFDVSLDWLFAGRGTAPDPEKVAAAVRRARRLAKRAS